jgi:hypothetical protein
MPNSQTYISFFNLVKESIDKGTFSKLTLAKTIGNTDLKNIYARAIIQDGELEFAVTLRSQTEEEVVNYSINEAFFVLTTYINNPFLSALLFTTDADIVMKINKKKVATIITEPFATFKHADPVIVDFLKSK